LPSDIEWSSGRQKTIYRTGQRIQSQKNGKQPIISMFGFNEMPEMKMNFERKDGI
jgi:hypothetical protein